MEGSATPVYKGGKLPVLHSYEPAEYPAVAGEGRPRRRIGCAEVATEGKFGQSNLWSMFEQAATTHASALCLGKRVPAFTGPFAFLTYAEVLVQCKIAGAGLRALGLEPGDCVGLYAPNSMEWAYASLGAYSQSITIVPLYDTLGEDAVRYEITHAELKVVVCAQKHLAAVAKVKDQVPTLKTIVQVEKLVAGDASADELTAAGIAIVDFESLMTNGEKAATPPTVPYYKSIYPSIYLSVYLSVYLSIYRSVYLCVYLYLYIYIFIYIYICMYVSIYIYIIYIYIFTCFWKPCLRK